MCGIAGYLGFEDNREAVAVVRKMNQSMTHRGPDAEGEYIDDNVALGHRRLSIIDLSSSGKQPMSCSDERFHIIYNGEIYNFQSLKKELRDYPYKSETDTEVLLAAWKRWGDKCINQIEGMFAFAIWDKIKKELFLVRDRLGIKPLYYYQKGSKLLFASELRALLASNEVPRKINLKGLSDYLRYQTVHAPDTIVDNVQMLMPGSYLKYSTYTGESSFHQYWDLEPGENDVNEALNYNDVKKCVNELLFQAVDKRLVSDVPFGAFLSGGIDSSIVVGIMSEVLPRKAKTFSITFDEKSHDEATYSRMIANRFKTDHTEIRLTPDDFLDYLPGALHSMDHPSGDGPNTYVLSRITKEAGVTMALSGLGGDELFAGYNIFQQSLKIEKYKWLSGFPKSVRSISGNALKKLRPSISSAKISELLNYDDWSFEFSYPLSRQLFMEDVLMELLRMEVYSDQNSNRKILNNINKGHHKKFLIARTSRAEISTYMQNVLLRDTDQMSMASSLEVRVPFLDHQLVDYVLNLPDEVKLPATPKKLLTDSLEGLIPDDVIHRKKMGFELPWKTWLKGPLKSMAEKHIINLSKREFMNENAVLTHWHRFLRNDPFVNWSGIWVLVILDKWLTDNKIES